MKDEPIRTPAPAGEKHAPTQQEFADAYLALCKQTGWQIAGHAALKPMNDLGGYMITVQLSVVQYVEPPK